VAIAFGTAGALAATVTGSITPALPSGTAQDDFLIAHVAHAATSTIATPSGWNAGTNFTFGTYRIYFFWKFAAAGETAPTFTVSATGAYGVISR